MEGFCVRSPDRKGPVCAPRLTRRVPHSCAIPRSGSVAWVGLGFVAAIPGPVGFDLDHAGLADEVVAEAAPRPVLGLFD